VISRPQPSQARFWPALVSLSLPPIFTLSPLIFSLYSPFLLSLSLFPSLFSFIYLSLSLCVTLALSFSSLPLYLLLSPLLSCWPLDAELTPTFKCPATWKCDTRVLVLAPRSTTSTWSDPRVHDPRDLPPSLSLSLLYLYNNNLLYLNAYVRWLPRVSEFEIFTVLSVFRRVFSLFWIPRFDRHFIIFPGTLYCIFGHVYWDQCHVSIFCGLMPVIV